MVLGGKGERGEARNKNIPLILRRRPVSIDGRQKTDDL